MKAKQESYYAYGSSDDLVIITGDEDDEKDVYDNPVEVELPWGVEVEVNYDGVWEFDIVEEARSKYAMVFSEDTVPEEKFNDYTELVKVVRILTEFTCPSCGHAVETIPDPVLVNGGPRTKGHSDQSTHICPMCQHEGWRQGWEMEGTPEA